MSQFVPLKIFPPNTNKRIGCRAVVLSEKRGIDAFRGILQMRNFRADFIIDLVLTSTSTLQRYRQMILSAIKTIKYE